MRSVLIALGAAGALLVGCNSILGIHELATGDAGPSGGPCTQGMTRACYSGTAATQDVGPCHGGTQRCQTDDTWGACDGEVVPIAEICGNGVDDNCSGTPDEDVDADHDGFTTCGGDCCDSNECPNPGQVNPGAYEVPGNQVDDDCDTKVDDVVTCDQGIASDAADPLDFARAMDLCQTATAGDRKWGVLAAAWTFTDGTGVPDARGHAIRAHYGPNLTPRAGSALGILSTGVAAAEADTNPTFVAGLMLDRAQHAGFPADWLAANGNALPASPGCPGPTGNQANDPVMLTVTLRAPTNARSFAFDSNFYTAEFPEWVCTAFNDFMVVLLDSTWAGTPGNPADKNLASYRDSKAARWPLGVNLALLNSGLFTQCVNGKLGCSATGLNATITSCTGVAQLAGTGFQQPAANMCDANSLVGGASGWLTTRGNVVGGETLKLRIAIWDTSDGILDSTAILDHFRWSPETVTPGTDVE